MDFFGIGPGEILLILVVILIIFGPGKIPEIARGLGKTVHAFRKASSELSTAVTREIEEQNKAEKQKEAVKDSPAPVQDKKGPDEVVVPGASI